MTLRFTADALCEIDEILATIEVGSPSGAVRVGERIFDVADLVADNPGMGSRTRRAGLRRIVVTPFPHLPFHELGATDVTVIAIRHAARYPRTMPGAR